MGRAHEGSTNSGGGSRYRKPCKVLLKSHGPISVIVIIIITPVRAYSVNIKEREAHGGYITSLSPITWKAVFKIQTQARL